LLANSFSSLRHRDVRAALNFLFSVGDKFIYRLRCAEAAQNAQPAWLKDVHLLSTPRRAELLNRKCRTYARRLGRFTAHWGALNLQVNFRPLRGLREKAKM
jgi:hypothetical protein